MSRSLSIFGATGSVGEQTLDLVRRNRADWNVVALTANSNVAALADAAREFAAEVAVVADERHLDDLRDALAGSGIEAAAGRSALCEAAARPVDMTVAAIVGCAGLGPVMAAIEQGGTIALANKEALVSAGEVETLLHLGSVEDILIQKNEEISESAIREFMSSVANERSEEFSNPDHAYPNAMLIILGKSYTEDLRFDAAHSLLDNKEIKEDPVLLTRLKSSFCN